MRFTTQTTTWITTTITDFQFSLWDSRVRTFNCGYCGWDLTTFNSLYEIRSSGCCLAVGYEKQLSILSMRFVHSDSGHDYTVFYNMRPFNSLYEIHQYGEKVATKAIHVLSILSMRFPARPSKINILLECNFQFSLWDSETNTTVTPKYTLIDFQFSLWDSLGGLAHASTLFEPSFQFSLWDSSSWRRLRKPWCL